jgi:hypothetical protein
LILMNVTPYVQMVTSGIALVMAAALDAVGGGLAARLERTRRVAQQQQSKAPRPATEAPAHGSVAD